MKKKYRLSFDTIQILSLISIILEKHPSGSFFKDTVIFWEEDDEKFVFYDLVNNKLLIKELFAQEFNIRIMTSLHGIMSMYNGEVIVISLEDDYIFDMEDNDEKLENENTNLKKDPVIVQFNPIKETKE